MKSMYTTKCFCEPDNCVMLVVLHAMCQSFAACLDGEPFKVQISVIVIDI